MPALTLAKAESLLGSYIEPSGDFTASLNQVLARIYSMGTYRDLTVQYSLPVVDGCITLPDEADAVLHVLIDGRPMPVRALWHDFRSVGNNQVSADMSWGLIDAGYHPTLRLLTEATDTLYVVPSLNGTTTGAFSEEDGTVIVVATDGTQLYQSSAVDDTLTFDAPVTSIVSISYSDLDGRFDLRTDLMDGDSAIATVGTGSGVCRYRRFRVAVNTGADTATVHVLCKRAFMPLVDDNDILYVGNINAIKHGLLGRIAEDNADLERSDYHWNKCLALLEEEASSSRGAAIPRLNIDPFGTNGMSRLINPL